MTTVALRAGTPQLRIDPADGPIVVRPAPRREPPFDDELALDVVRAGADEPWLPYPTPRRPPLRAVPPLSCGTLPDPARWGVRVLVGVIEAADGRRPLTQLARLLAPPLATALRSDFEYAARRGRPHWIHRAHVRSVRASVPADDVAELSATLAVGPRVRAAALRLEARHGDWRCTRLVLG